MKTIRRMKKLIFLFGVGILLLSLPAKVSADIAPPYMPPGSNPSTQDESTQVQMLAEEVILQVVTYQKEPRQYAGDFARALVSAHFVMRNQGAQDEKMWVYYPIGDPTGYGAVGTITDLSVKVDQVVVKTQPGEGDWVKFETTFPVGVEVLIDVTYTLEATGYIPYGSFKYILQTGAGWKDVIGSADIIVHLPYEANLLNVMSEQSGWSKTSPDAQLVGNEIRWHFEDLEPEFNDNIEVTFVLPHIWQEILDMRAVVQNDPGSSTAWGNLARAYKGIYVLGRGVREGEGGRELFALSEAAYEKATGLSPNTPRWHAGFGELLWEHYYYTYYFGDPGQQDTLLRAVQELQTALKLQPANTQAQEVLAEICSATTNIVTASDGCMTAPFNYLILTATPYYPLTATLTSTATETRLLTPTSLPPTASVTPQATLTATEMPASPTEAQATPPPATPGRLPCPAPLLPLAMMGGLIWWGKRAGSRRDTNS